MKVRKSHKKTKASRQGKTETRRGVEDGRSGRDSSYLNDPTRRAGDEGSRPGVHENKRKPDRLADES